MIEAGRRLVDEKKLDFERKRNKIIRRNKHKYTQKVLRIVLEGAKLESLLSPTKLKPINFHRKENKKKSFETHKKRFLGFVQFLSSRDIARHSLGVDQLAEK